MVSVRQRQRSLLIFKNALQLQFASLVSDDALMSNDAGGSPFPLRRVHEGGTFDPHERPRLRRERSWPGGRDRDSSKEN